MIDALVRDALAPWRSSEESAEMLFDAMLEGGIAVIPDSADEQAAFVRAHLVPLVEREVGAGAARALEEALRSLDPFDLGEPGESGIHETARPTRPAPLEAMRTVVTVLAMDARVAQAAIQHLSDAAEVRALPGLAELIAHESLAPSLAPPIVLVDCRSGLVGSRPDPSALRGAPVVLWNARAFHEAQLAKLAPGAVLTGTVAPGVPLADALAKVRAIVDRRADRVTA